MLNSKKVKLGAQVVPGVPDLDQAAELLTAPYHRFTVLHRVVDSSGFTPLFDLLRTLTCERVYELFSRVKSYRLFLLIVGGHKKCPEFLRDLEQGAEVGLYGQLREVKGPSPFLYFVLHEPKSHHLLFAHPEHSFRVTSLTETITLCTRRHALNRQYLSKGRVPEKHGLLGSLRHRVFQEVVMRQGVRTGLDDLWQEQLLQEVDFFPQLAPQDLEEFRAEMGGMVEKSLAFWDKYVVHATPVTSLAGNEAKPPKKGSLEKVQILGPVSSEFLMNSHTFSLRGKIDLLLKVRHFSSEGAAGVVRIIPFELKTGKEKEQYRDQVLLYNVCFHQGFTPGFSLVYYSQTDKFVWVANDFARLADLVHKRNAIVVAAKGPALPPPISDRMVCNNLCTQNVNCAFHSFLTSTAANPALVPDLEDLGNGRVTPYPFLEHSLQLEKKLATAPRLRYAEQLLRDIAAEEQRAAERTVSPASPFTFIFAAFRMHYNAFVGKEPPRRLLNFDLYFKRENRAATLEYLRGLAVNSEVSFLNKFNPDFRLDGRVSNFTCEEMARVFNFKVSFEMVSPEQLAHIFRQIELEPDFFDKYSQEWVLGPSDLTDFAKMRTSLLAFLTSPVLAPLADTVVAATHDFPLTSRLQVAQRQPLEATSSQGKLLSRFGLNWEQSQAVHRTLLQPDFRLIQGLTGTGKSLVTAALLCELLAAGQRTLFCGQTSTLKRVAAKVAQWLPSDALRRVMSLHKLRISEDFEPFDVFDARLNTKLEDYWAYVDRHLFLGATHALDKLKFNERDFEVVVVADAQWLPEPTLLRLLGLGKRFVLVGDLFLGPPASDVSPAADAPLSQRPSLFEKMCRGFPFKVSSLRQQFRMSGALASLSNKLVYGGLLEHGPDPDPPATEPMVIPRNATVKVWVREVLSSDKFLPAVFVDTSNSFSDEKWDRAIDLVGEFGESASAPFPDPLFSHRIEPEDSEETLRDLSAAFDLLRGLRAGTGGLGDVAVLTNCFYFKEKLAEYLGRQLEVSMLDKAHEVSNKIVLLLLFVGLQASPSLLQPLDRLPVCLARAQNRLVVVGASKELRRHPGTLELIRHFSHEGKVVNIVRSEAQVFLEKLELNN